MIHVRFSCPGCILKDEIVEVLPREKEQDVVWWMKNQVSAAITLKHALLSPFCKSLKMDIVIPAGNKDDPDPWIGKATDTIPPKGIIKT